MPAQRLDAKRPGARQALLPHVAFAALALLCYLLIVGTPLFDTLELRAGDLLFRWRQAVARPVPPAEVVIVAIDEASMQEIGLPWPWPRAVHADLIDALAAAGAATIGFDILFLEAGDPLHDGFLEDAIRRAGNVVLAEEYSVADDSGQRREQWLRPYAPLLQASAGTGLVSVVSDADGFVRRAFLETPVLGGRRVPAFSRAVAELWLARRGASLGAVPGFPAEPLIANYLGPPGTVRRVSYYQALAPDEFLPGDIFRDKIVLVGRSLLGAVRLDTPDHFGQPFHGATRGAMPGVEIHATLLDTLLRRRFLTPLPAWLGGLAFLCVLGVVGAGLRAFPRWGGLALGAALGLALIAGAFLLFALAGRQAPWLAALLGLGAFIVMERAHKIIVVDRDKRFIQKAFRHYVSPAVVDRLIDDPALLQLGGERYETTVVFTDLVGFTALSEGLQPTELREFLTDYFTEMTDILLAHGGTLDKFIGDAILCCFGVPVANDQHPYQGALTAWAMQRRLTELNRTWAAAGRPALAMRIGVNSGPVTAGNIGTRTLFNYTIMGDTVNLCARLESANKFYGTSILIGEATRERIADRMATRAIDRVRVQGKERPVRVYELLGPRDDLEPHRAAAAARYERALEAYERRAFAEALAILEDADPDDRAAAVLGGRCKEYAQDPPPADWDGVYAMTTK